MNTENPFINGIIEAINPKISEPEQVVEPIVETPVGNQIEIEPVVENKETTMS